MNRISVRTFVFSLFVCLAVLFLCGSPIWAQSGTTGGLTGTVTDPSGGVIVGATVTATNVGTGQERSVTTDSSGVYKFSLLQPGNYSVKIAAAGFKTAQIQSVTVNVTETPVLNQKLEVGAQTEQVTVESTVETVQTQNATVGTLVGSQTVTTLPLSSRNYTNIIDLSPGVVANVASAAAVGNGTQDINVNGNGSDQNNYMMDGATLTNYGSGGAAQSGNFPGIAIPNPDAIQEFKIQTSQYDAEYGRNPGASVNVTTKDGSNSLHGAAWEFFRNTALDANDIFNRLSQVSLNQPNKPQTLTENMFGGTLGGPIKKDKLFFFGSYQGFRQKNAVGTNGFATGLSTGITLYPFTAPGANGGRGNSVSGTIPLDYNPTAGAPTCNYATYRQYLGCAFGGTSSLLSFIGLGAGVPVANNGSNINQVAINLLQMPGPKGTVSQGFYFPGAPFNGLVPIVTSSAVAAVPTTANEDQYLGNIQYVMSSKNTLYQKFFYSKDPQLQSFTCLDGNGNLVNSCAPGAPENVKYTSLNETLKLTTVVTNNLVNEALFSFIRTTTVAVAGNYFTACSVGIIPPLANGACDNIPSPNNINPVQLQVPTITISGLPLLAPGPVGYGTGTLNTGGNFFSSATNYFNTFEGKDNISWNHGKHTIRAGVEVDRLQYNWTLPGRGGMFFPTVADFLTSSSGSAATQTPTAVPNGIFVNFYGITTTNGNKHDQRTNEFASYLEDDIKVTSKLTVNLGVRWEYDGYPSDTTGLFTNGWASQAALVNTGSFFLGNQTGPGGNIANPSNQIGTLAGLVVQSNYNPNIAQCGLPLAPSACGLTAPAGIYPGYPGGATGVYFNTNKTLVHGAPISNFGPRVGVAWQPFGEKFVVRAGYGIYYDAVYANLLANNNGGNPPYNAFVNGSFPANALDLPIAAGATGGILGWTPRTLHVLTGTAGTGATLIMDNSGGLGIGPTSINEGISTPLIQQYNLDLQYEVAHSWVVDIGYVGSHGTKLYDWAHTVNYAFLAPNAPNGPAAGDLQDARMILGSGAQGTPNSFVFNDVANTNPATQVKYNTGNSAAYPGNQLGRNSYLGFSTTGLSNTTTQGDSLYNSLQVQLRHQFSHGFLLQASYTWSKLMTNINSPEAGGGISAPGNVLSGGASSNDPLDFAQQYGLAAFNRPQRLVIAYSYDLPYHHTEGISGKILGGWTVSGVTTIQDGEPFTVIDSNAGTIFGAGGFGGGGVRAELAPGNTGKCNKYGVCQGIGLANPGSNHQRVISGLTDPCSANPGWINLNAFGSPAGTCSGLGGTFSDVRRAPCIGGIPNPGGTDAPTEGCGAFPNPFAFPFPDPGYTFVGAGTGFGNSAIGSITGPGQHNWDISIIKHTKITERLNTEFRTEFYNVWNHAQFNPPVNNAADSTFGQIQNSSVPPRIMQFALKFLF
ncbi:MAG: TonB-dependent receptor [Candidatus Acidoferrales bacterium]|nr:TonB-dependent receptor [Candidatus Acidoferrales bacterium]